MASSEEDDRKLLLEQNTELVTKVQFWKMKAAQLEAEKLELVKENNTLRLKLSNLRHVGANQARALDLALQATSEEALTHIVKASSALTRTVELTKTYLRQREELVASTHRWSTLSSSPDNNKVHKVPPLLMGGKTIQPFVSLSRVPLNESNSNSIDRSSNPSRNSNERVLPLPMHVLQDVYIPLRRLDAADLLNHNATETDRQGDVESDILNNIEENSASDNELEESQNMSSGEDPDLSNRPLTVVNEDTEESDEDVGDDEGPSSDAAENPLEGPSWLLDRPHSSKRRGKSCVTLEADSTTEPDESRTYTPSPILPATMPAEGSLAVGSPESRVFTPTVRRRKRISSPPALPSPTLPTHLSPRLHVHKNCAKSRECSSRVLKVIVPKIRLEAAGGDSPPAKRVASFDAPSPNGATDAAVIVMEENPDTPEDNIVSEPPAKQSLTRVNTNSRPNSRDSATEDNTRELNITTAASRTKADASSHKSNGDSRNSSHMQAGPSWLSDGDSRTLGSDANVTARARGSDANVSVRARGSAANVSSRTTGRSSRDNSVEGETSGRTRRPKKQVTYKEKPLNRKMRR